MTQHDISLTAARIGKGKALHHYYPEATRTSCAAGGMGDADATIVEGGVITCKTCLKSLAKDVEYYHGVAIEMDEKRTIARASQSTPSHVATDWAQVEQAHTAYVARSNGDVQAAEPVFMVWHEASGEPFLSEGTDETGEYVWLRDLTHWDAHRVGVEILRAGYTARQPGTAPEQPTAPIVEVAELLVRKVVGGSDTFRVLGSEQVARVGHVLTVLWLQNVLNGVQHCIRPDTLESHYVAAGQDGTPYVADRPEAPAEPFTWLHLRVETSDELATLTQALEYRASAPTRAALARAASTLLKRLRETPRGRQSHTTAGEVTEYSVGDEVRVRRGGAVVRGRVTFIGAARNVFHVQPLRGGSEFVAMRDSVLGRI